VTRRKTAIAISVYNNNKEIYGYQKMQNFMQISNSLIQVQRVSQKRQEALTKGLKTEKTQN
jgi:hypothetical protein